jgi:hypothetical protein
LLVGTTFAACTPASCTVSSTTDSMAKIPRLPLLVRHLVHLLHLHLVEAACSSKSASTHLVGVGFAGLHVTVGLSLSSLRCPPFASSSRAPSNPPPERVQKRISCHFSDPIGSRPAVGYQTATYSRSARSPKTQNVSRARRVARGDAVRRFPWISEQC